MAETTKKNSKIFIAIGAGLLVVIIVVVVFFLKSRGESTETDVVGPITPKPIVTAPAAGTPGAVPITVAAVPTAPATPAPAALPAQPGAPGAPVLAGPTREPNRPDPFVIIAPPPPPPSAAPLPVIPQALVMERGFHIDMPHHLVTSRRAAGLVWNGDVYGLLELGNNDYIVRPGDKVGDYKVIAITRDSIVLHDIPLNQEIQVPLQGPGARISEETGASPVARLSGLSGTAPGTANFGTSVPGLPQVPIE